MWGLVFRIRQYLRGSLWFLPVLGGILGALLAALGSLVDQTIELPAYWQY